MNPTFISGMIAERPRAAGVSAPVSDMPTEPFFASIFSVKSRHASARRAPLYALKAESMRSLARTFFLIGSGSRRGNFLFNELMRRESKRSVGTDQLFFRERCVRKT